MEEIEEVDLIKKCRACLCDEDDQTTMHSLFAEFDQGYTLADILKSTVYSNKDVNLVQDDGTPNNLCENCTATIVDYFNLKLRYEENEQYLKTLLETTNKNDVDSKGENQGNEIVEGRTEQIEVIIVENEEHEERTLNTIAEEEIINLTVEESAHAKTKVGEGNEMISEPVNQDYIKLYGTDKISRLLYEAACRDSLTDDDNSNFELQECKKYSCPHCTKYFFDQMFFEKHLAHDHETEIPLSDAHSSTIKMQVRKTELPKTGACKKCKIVLPSEEALRIHNMDTHNKFVCDQCGAGFARKSYLSDHKQVHSPARQFICPFCQKTFQRRTVLLKHKKIHTNSRQVICEVCGRAFNNKTALGTHIKLRHIGDRNFKCPMCNQNFSMKSTLQKHILRHDKDRQSSYSCDQCDVSYKDKSSLTRHNFLKHGDGKYEFYCEKCKNCFAEGSSLKRHMRTFHPESLENTKDTDSS